MKSFVVLSLLVVALTYSPAPASAGIRRVLRDTDEVTKEKDPAEVTEESLRKTLQKAAMKLRQHGSETLKADIDMLESALNSGALDDTIAKVRKDLAGSKPDLGKLLSSFQQQASGDIREVVERISKESTAFLDRLHKHSQHAGDRIKALADAIPDSAAAV